MTKNYFSQFGLPLFRAACLAFLTAPLGSVPVMADDPEPPAQSLSQQLQDRDLPHLAVTCLAEGNPVHGEAIYKRESLGCVKCHVASPANKKLRIRSIGPDQATIGDRLTPERLVEAVLFPNRTIAKGYESFVILTNSGAVHTGVLTAQSPTQVELMSPETGVVATIPRVDIDEMQPANSAMPEALVDQLKDPQEFYDLIAYLSSKRASSHGTPVAATNDIVVREVEPHNEGRPLLAIAQPNGVCFTFDPNQFRLEAIWKGPLGWLDEEGHFTLNQTDTLPFHIRKQPWKIDMGKIPLNYQWLGYTLDDKQARFQYRLIDQEQGRQWTVTELLSAPSLAHQVLEFHIDHPSDSHEVLTYWLDQTHYRNVSSNGQQAQRNQLEFLHPGQTAFQLTLSRRPPGRTIPAGYTLTRVIGPDVEKPFLFEPTGFSFATDGTLFVSTRTGGIWRRKGERWNLFADGLHETLGVRAAPNGRDVYTMQKPELTLLEDTDENGFADCYHSVANMFRFTGSYHEFAYGPVTNTAGDLFFSTGLAASGHHEAKQSRTGQMSSPLGYRGWVMKVSADGNLTAFASGLRSPAGIGINSADELFVTDNQGDWVASSYLSHVEQDDFLGHPAALWDRPEYGLTPPQLDYRTVRQSVAEVPPLDERRYRAERKPPAVWLVHGDVTNSPGNPSFAPQTKFGPFSGQAFIADIAHRAIVRVALEKINGVYQGAVFPFIRPLASASYCTCFDPQGRLWVGSVGRGWTTGDPMIEVVTYDGQTMPYEMQRIRLVPEGFAVDFTKPLSLETEQQAMVSVKQFHYLYWAEYGSDRQEVRRLPAPTPQLSADGLTLTLPVSIERGKVYEIDLGQMKAASGEVLRNNFAFYTVNEVIQ